ncbi:sodium:solute symporter [bacterium]|nr:sodium:solute symporter [bacterium]
MLSYIDLSVIGIYLLGILALGFFLQKKAGKSIDAYFLGNRKMPWWALGASGMASNTDIAGTMVITAMIYVMGLKGFFVEVRGGIVLVMAFFMIFMGKWTRRANVMTLAEWMKLRFGEGREGQIARFICAVANIVISIWIISFFAVGGGKFLGEFLGMNDQLASVLLIVLAMVYTAASGFYGVVWTDVLQGGMILFSILYVCYIAMDLVSLPEAFQVSVPLKDGGFELMSVKLSEWTNFWPPMETEFPGKYSIYNLFGVTILFYFIKTFIEGFGGAGGYMSQRYFAAKSDREAGLLSVFWILLLAFRWPLVMAFATLAIYHGMTQGVIEDPELVLPVVINEYIPVGFKGLLIACFIAAAMSTFDSVINSSAAYWVKDIYHIHINPKATDKQLMTQSRVSSVAIVVIGLLFSFPVVNINDIWGWITMAFGSGIFVPLLLRWYWWRYNGYGFAAGIVLGMIAAVGIKFTSVAVPEYMNFVIPGGFALLGCILGTLLTPQTNPETLKNFYIKTRPFGFWGKIKKELPEADQKSIDQETRRDLMAIVLAVPWQLSLFIMGMMFIIKQWDQFFMLLSGFLVLSVGLYFSWFRHLNANEKLER